MLTRADPLNSSKNDSMVTLEASLVGADAIQGEPCHSSHGSHNDGPPSLECNPSGNKLNQISAQACSSYIESKIKILLEGQTSEERSSPVVSSSSALLLASEDSCNAVDNKLSSHSCDSVEETGKNVQSRRSGELSFNGKINGLNEQFTEEQNLMNSPGSEAMRKERINVSFEILTKENSNLMYLNNERSPDLFADEDEDTDDLGVGRGHGSTLEDSMSISVLQEDDDDKAANNSLTETEKTSDDPIVQVDRAILRRLKAALTGVLPPPSVTLPSHIDINTILASCKEREANFFSSCANIDGEATSSKGGLCKPTCTLDELKALEWPAMLRVQAHGLHYNRSAHSEDIELFCLRFVERYVGSETCSTFNSGSAFRSSPSSAKKRALRQKMLNQSPGRRLSHLARRRAIFSSANLLNCSSSSSLGSVAGTSALSTGVHSNPFRLCNRQIMLDPKKSENRRKSKVRTPKRRTPGRKKTPRRKTPGSSSKKKTLSLRVPASSVASASKSSLASSSCTALQPHPKRALFQSPPTEPTDAAVPHPSSSASCLAIASKVQRSKRALFSPAKRIHRFSSATAAQSSSSNTATFGDSLVSPHCYGSMDSLSQRKPIGGENVPDERLGKRRRLPSDVPVGDTAEETGSRRCGGKIPRMESDTVKSIINEADLTPRSLKFARSQSFCAGSQTLANATRIGTAEESGLLCGGKALFRANSEVTDSATNSASQPVTMLTENHKKKLLWAVSQALQAKQISVKHENFKQFASNLARVVKRLFLEFKDNSTTSTSEKMLRLANKHVFDVIQGRSVDDIYLKEKTRIINARNLTKLQGYIAPEEYEQRKKQQQEQLKRSVSTSGLMFGENSQDLSLSLTSSQQKSQDDGSLLSQMSTTFSQSSEYLNQLSQNFSQGRSGVGSNSKANNSVVLSLGSTILRENIDSEQRQKSAHKQQPHSLGSFSGRDQKNMSPYADQKGGMQQHAKCSKLSGSANSVLMKAKRQISFE